MVKKLKLGWGPPNQLSDCRVSETCTVQQLIGQESGIRTLDIHRTTAHQCPVLTN